MTLRDMTENEEINRLRGINAELLKALRGVVKDYRFSAKGRPLDMVYAAEHPVMAALAAISKATGKAVKA